MAMLPCCKVACNTAGAASAAEDRMLDTWREAFKLACQETLLTHGIPNRNVLTEVE